MANQIYKCPFFFPSDISILADFGTQWKRINKYIFVNYFHPWLLDDHGFFWCVFFPPWPKLFSLEMFQHYTANISPLWTSSGKFCNLNKHLSHLKGVSVDLQTGDQKHTANIFGLSQKEFGWFLQLSLFVYNNLLKKLGHFSHIRWFWG